MNLNDKTALITGGNSGIGLATARLLIAQGTRVVITGRDQKKLDEALINLGDTARGIRADLTDMQAIETLAKDVGAAFGHLDILFANAGVSGPTPLGSTTLQAFEAILRTNLTSVFFTIQAVLPLLSAGSAIVLNGSVMRELGSPGSSAYSASKAAITGMAKVLAAELAPKGIRVNTVIPGATRTPAWTRGARQGATLEGTEKTFAPRIPMKRMAEADEVAQAVVFLASSAASGMTAAEIVVDGGTIGAPWGAPIIQNG
jgi:NAD(P)-dependent dehydrogenase (short-subunit alcohol dehydrogenase family)